MRPSVIGVAPSSAAIPSCTRYKERTDAWTVFFKSQLDYSITQTLLTLNYPRLTTGWTVRGSNPGGGEIFRIRPDRSWGDPSLLYDGHRVFSGGKAAGAWRRPPIPSRVEVKWRVELYLYATSGHSWPVLRWTLKHARDLKPKPKPPVGKKKNGNFGRVSC